MYLKNKYVIVDATLKDNK